MKCTSILGRASVAVRHAALVAASAAILLSTTAFAQDSQFGAPGSPVKLVVGYQPYGTENLDSIIMKEKQLWKKYLPAGSTVDMEVALHPAPRRGTDAVARQRTGPLNVASIRFWRQLV